MKPTSASSASANSSSSPASTSTPVSSAESASDAYADSFSPRHVPFTWADALISAVLNDVDGVVTPGLLERVPLAGFQLTHECKAWQAFRDATDLSNPFAVLARAGMQPGDIMRWIEVDRAGAHTAEAERQIVSAWRTTRQRALAADFSNGLLDFDDFRARMAETTKGTEQEPGMRARLRERRFDSARPPAEPEARFFIKGRPISTPGNLTNLLAQAKAGKSALIGALLSATLCAAAGITDKDTLGITAAAPAGRVLLHIDTEQSRHDHDALLRRALRRAGVDTAPDWLRSYSLAGFSVAELREALRVLVAEAARSGGIFAIVIDGTGDLVNDVNDAEECNPFVASLHALAIRHDCPIVNVVHENPGQDFGKMRGHLGSQLERKGEANLRLRKAEGVTTVFSEKMRRAPLPEKDGLRFSWSDEAGMHVGCGPSVVTALAEQRKQEEFEELARELFQGRRMRYAQVVRAMELTKGLTLKTAERRFGELKRAGVIAKEADGYWAVVANETFANSTAANRNEDPQSLSHPQSTLSLE